MRTVTPILLLILFTAACGGASDTPAAATLYPSSTAVPATVPPAPVDPTGTAAPPTNTTAGASSFPDPAAYKWVQVASGLIQPTDIKFPDDGSGRMFILEQPGQIVMLQDGQPVSPPFLDITSKVGSAGSEQGLLGLAFHPDFAHNPYFYINYTDINGNTVIARYQSRGNQADPNSEKVLLRVDQPFPNHNGGSTLFGPDGFLYLGLGDGGSGGDPLGNGQNTGVVLGKLLRIDVDHGDPYAIPQGNPFASGGGRPEVWAYGLRNPWRVSFDRLTGDLYIADVGQDSWEEVDFLPAGSPGGENFGWNFREGLHQFSRASPPSGAQFIEPVAEYSHAEGGCSITGGYVYRGAMQAWQGVYFYGDYCSGNVWGLSRSGAPGSSLTWQSKLLFQTGAHITTFGQDPSGELYLADRGGTIYKLTK